MTYADYVYYILVHDAQGLDSIYEDYIINLVGVTGLTELRSNNLIETCGVVNGRQLYVVCDKK